MKEIPSAGPWITRKEVDYVSDACENGWYNNWHGYLDRFEDAMRSYIDLKHALATSSCTGALHIVMKALDLKEGDEVIVPEISWIATVTAVCYEGLTPVFVDIERDTWCMDPEAFRKAITPKTRVVIPVHMYGHPSEMNEINRIAKEHDIIVLEDAAPGIGSRYHGKMAGSLGDISVFSFQGAKPLVTGEGGMIMTNDDDLFERCYYYWDHCRDPKKVLYNTDIGLKYKMSNIQAALGLAQVERADEIISKRRQIFFWYKERIGDIPGLDLNVERPDVYNSFYVPTIILSGDFPVTADELMTKLDEKGIRNRPFFRPMSKFPMFEDCKNPVAEYLAEHGINLPCATKMTEEQVDYTCAEIKQILA